MIIQAYGLNFIRLHKKDDIELVRKWRNSEKINQYMNFKDVITQKMQKEWFASINNLSNYYFIIESRETKIGLLKLSDINSNRVGETGIFIWDDNYLYMGIPPLSFLMILDFAFYFLRLKKTYGKVQKDNTRAINFYLNLGGSVSGEIDDKQIIIEALKEVYGPKISKLKKVANKFSRTNNKIIIILEKHDLKTELAPYMQHVFANLPIDLKEKFIVRVDS